MEESTHSGPFEIHQKKKKKTKENKRSQRDNTPAHTLSSTWPSLFIYMVLLTRGYLPGCKFSPTVLDSVTATMPCLGSANTRLAHYHYTWCRMGSMRCLAMHYAAITVHVPVFVYTTLLTRPRTPLMLSLRLLDTSSSPRRAAVVRRT